jgi:pilus assembly protein CpaB
LEPITYQNTPEEETEVKRIRIIALIAAVVTLLGILAVMNHKSLPMSSDAGSKVTIVVAAKNIVPSSVITKEMLTTKSMSAKNVQSTAFTDLSAAVGRISSTEIYAGEQLMQNNTSAVGDSKYGLAVRLPNGMRAATLNFESDTQGSLANLLRVGNRVDIVSILEVDNGDSQSKRMRASLLLQNQEIVALNGNVTNLNNTDDKATYKTVTLAVTPEDSLKLISAQASGSVRLILRPQSDEGMKNIGAFLIN